MRSSSINRPSRILAGLLGSLFVLGAVPALGDEPIPPVPCADPRGCPDLLVDTVRLAEGAKFRVNYAPSSCAVQEGMIQPGPRTVLRFTFNTPNAGAGDLIIGSPADHPEWFVYHACHDHYHFREYADYRLWTPGGFLTWDQLREAEPEKTAQQVLDEHPELVQEFVAGSKAGFCVIDILPALPNPRGVAVPPDLPKYGSCDNNQGISRGWADEYTYSLTGQWIDVTDVRSGAYIIEAEVNAEHLYVEESYANNRAWIPTVV